MLLRSRYAVAFHLEKLEISAPGAKNLLTNIQINAIKRLRRGGNLRQEALVKKTAFGNEQL
jgi:hypothetical protein